MKKFVQILTMSILAVTVFLTGTGVTVIDFCCDSCGGQTLFITEHHTCCEQASLRHEENVSCCAIADKDTATDCDKLAYAQDSHCAPSRVSADIDASSFRPHVSTPVVWITDAFFVMQGSILFQTIEAADNFIHFKSPPDIPPRDYLSLIRILII